MSNLAGFLKPTYTEKTVEIDISDRFLDDNGEPLHFKLKTLTQEQMQQIAKRSIKEKVVNGKKVQEVDKLQHLARCIVESCIQPDFKDRELCLANGTEDPVELPQKMLLVSEYEKLTRAFLDLNGLTGDSPEFGEVSKN